MRSVYAKVLLGCLAALLFSLSALVAIAVYVPRRSLETGGALPKMTQYLLDECVMAWSRGGKPALAAALKDQRQNFPFSLYVTDARGTDLLSGESRTELLRQEGHFVGGGPVTVRRSSMGDYRGIYVLSPPPIDFWGFIPYFALILSALAGLCWLLAVNLASPIRDLSLAVERFGRGDLDARLVLERGDEIGDLARSFNKMASRLQTLLMAERRLLQDISHELRSPLARLTFAAELTRNAPDRDAAANRLKREIDRLTDLVAALLEVTRAEGDPQEQSLELVSLDKLVLDIAQDCEIEASAKDCRLAPEVSSPILLRGRAELLRRAIENVLSNAIRHAPASSIIDIHVSSEDATALVTIRDRGAGVPEESLSKIFNPFYRVDEARADSTGGVGLGLAIARRAVLLHHGRIRAVNSKPGLSVIIEMPSITA